MEVLRPLSSHRPTTQPVDISPPSSIHQGPPIQLELEDLYCILQISPHDSVIAMELARQLVEMNRHDEALKILRSVIKIDSRFESVYALAQVEYALDQLDSSLQHFHEALLIAGGERPELFEIFRTIGNIFVRQGDLETAEENYFKAHRLKMDSDVVWVNLGTVMIHRQNWTEAVDRFRRALAVNPSNDKAWIGLAIGHRMLSDVELAWGNLEAAVQHNPLNDVALVLALEWGAQEGREFRVLEMIRTFLIKGGWNEKLSLAFCWLSWRRGDQDLARLELERLTAVNPQNLRALEMLSEMRAVL